MKKILAFLMVAFLTQSAFAAPAAKTNKKEAAAKKVNVLIIESGEYVAG